MLFSFCDGLWRVLTALAIGLLPAAAPLEMRTSTTSDGALLRLLAGSIVVAAVIFVIRWMTPKSQLAAGLWWLSLLVAAVASVAFADQAGPLSRVVWVMAPLVWASLGALAAEGLAAAVASLRPRAPRLLLGFVAAGLVVGGASVAAARGRFASREGSWREALSQDPGHQAAALGYYRYMRRAGKAAEGRRALLACSRAEPPPCGCVEEAALDALDRIAPGDALLTLEAARKACGGPASFRGLRAEALVGAGQLDLGEAEASAVLAEDKNNPYATFARANLLYIKGDLKAALEASRDAARLGRVSGGRMLAGLVHFRKGEFDDASRIFKLVLSTDPTNLPATYNLALVAHKTGRYREAREGYLKALSLEPRSFDARYNLVVLTRDAGATMEAKHHLAKLVQDHPGDPRIAPLLRQLGPPGAP